MSISLNASGLIPQDLRDEMINGRDIDSKKAAKLVNVIQRVLSSDPNPEAYLKEVFTALKYVGDKQITDIVNELERKLRLVVVNYFISKKQNICLIIFDVDVA